MNPSPAENANPQSSFRKLLERPILICVLLAVATFAAFWPVIHAGFINYDDPDYVANNPRVQNGLTWKGVAWAFTTRHASNWHPVTWLSHMLDAEMFGTGPRGPHIVNLGLHSLNAMLLFCGLRRMTKAHWQSALVAGLFALHPLHVESVAWISERKDVLSTLFALLTILIYAGWAGNRAAGPSATPGGNFGYWAALGLFAVGLMAKPMLVTLPFLLLLLDFWPLKRIELAAGQWLPRLPMRLVLEKIPFLLLSIASCIVTTWAQQKAIQPFEHLPLLARIFNAGVTYLRYLGKAIWPDNLALPYLHPGLWPTGIIVLAVIAMVAISVGAVFSTRRFPYVFVGWCWYLGTLVPVIGIMQVGIQSMADRYTYFPLCGIFVVLAWGIGDWLQRRESFRIPTVVGIISLITVLGGLTFRQAGYWKSGETLFKHTAAVTESNFIALGNVGGVLFESGRLDEAMEYYERAYAANPESPETINSIGAVLASRNDPTAIEWFRRALALQPNHADALFNMGNACARKEDYEQAARHYQRALQERPDNHEARNNLGNNLFKLRRIDEAIAEYRIALDYKPDAALVLKNLGEALAAKNQLDEAVACYRKAVGLTNDAGTHYALGMTLAVQGKWNEAITAYHAALTLRPTNAEVHYNLGYAHSIKKEMPMAEKHFREAVRLRPEFALAHYNLASILVLQGQKLEAIEHLRIALKTDPDYKDALEMLRKLEME